MRHGGNKKAREYFRSVGIDKLEISEKYSRSSAKQYASKLDAEARGKATVRFEEEKILARSASAPSPKELVTDKSMESFSHESEDHEASDFEPIAKPAPAPIAKPRPAAITRTERVAPKPAMGTKKKTTKPKIVKLTSQSFDDMLDEEPDFEEEKPQKQAVKHKSNVVRGPSFNDFDDFDDFKPQITATGSQRPKCKYGSYSNVPVDIPETTRPSNNQSSDQDLGTAAMKVMERVATNVAESISEAVSSAGQALAPIASAAWEKSKEFSQSLLNMMRG